MHGGEGATLALFWLAVRYDHGPRVQSRQPLDHLSLKVRSSLHPPGASGGELRRLAGPQDIALGSDRAARCHVSALGAHVCQVMADGHDRPS